MIILLLLLSLLHASDLRPIDTILVLDEAAYRPDNAQDAETNEQAEASKHDQQDAPPRHSETALAKMLV